MVVDGVLVSLIVQMVEKYKYDRVYIESRLTIAFPKTPGRLLPENPHCWVLQFHVSKVQMSPFQKNTLSRAEYNSPANLHAVLVWCMLGIFFIRKIKIITVLSCRTSRLIMPNLCTSIDKRIAIHLTTPQASP